jgi:hypothetical protein
MALNFIAVVSSASPVETNTLRLKVDVVASGLALCGGAIAPSTPTNMVKPAFPPFPFDVKLAMQMMPRRGWAISGEPPACRERRGLFGMIYT